MHDTICILSEAYGFRSDAYSTFSSKSKESLDEIEVNRRIAEY